MSATRSESPAAEARDLDVAIIGGGISGLVTAYRLSARAESGCRPSVRLFEASDRLGGLVQTELRGEWLFEAGPDSIVTAKRSAIDLCRELGLEDELIAPRSASGFSLVHDQRLHPLPAGFRMIAPTDPWSLLRSRLFSWPGKLRMLLEPWVPASVTSSHESAQGETVESFVVRRFGREAYDRVAEPVLGGLFTADATTLSARRVLGPFVELERRNGSVLRGLRASSAASTGTPGEAQPESRLPAQLSLQRGLGSLIQRLAEAIPAPWLQLGCSTKGLRPLPEEGRWRIETNSGNWRAREVVLACPTPRCCDLLRGALPTLAGALEELRFASCLTVSLVYRRSDLTLLPSDFGFFVPRAEPYQIVAATFSSEKFAARAPAQHVVVRTFQGGVLDPDALDLDDATLTERSHDDLARLIGAAAPPLSSKLCRFRQSVPQFDAGHIGRVADLRRQIEQHRGLHVVGSGMGAYGLPDCVTSGEEAAARIELPRGHAGAASPGEFRSLSVS